MGKKKRGTFVPDGNEGIVAPKEKPGTKPSDSPQTDKGEGRKPGPYSPFPEGTEIDVNRLPRYPNIDVGGGVFY